MKTFSTCLIPCVTLLLKFMYPVEVAGQCDPVQDSLALVALYNSTGGNNWTDKTNWKVPGQPIGTWYGIEVNAQGCVICIDMGGIADCDVYTGTGGNNLTGSIPPQLGTLSDLEKLMMPSNNLSGSIPPELGSLANLQFLYLYNNKLSGSIPPELGNLTPNFVALWLGNNNLSGSIPSSLGNLTGLQSLSLDSNYLTGPIPSSFGSLSNLNALWLQSNYTLSGSIPDELGSLTNLQSLLLYNNNLSGGIPSSLGSLTSLVELNLSNNPLGGTIPPELGSIGTLGYLYLSNNNLEGSIPASFSGLGGLVNLWLSGNPDLTGDIPSFIGDNLTNLRELILNNCSFTGAIPPSLGGLGSLRRLALNSNQLTDTIPSSLGNLGSLNHTFYLYNNNLQGCIPANLQNLCGVQYGSIFNNPGLSTQSWSNFCNNQEGMCGACTNYTATLSGSTTICNGNSANITFNFSGGNGPYDVTWTGGILNGIPNGHVETVSPFITTTYSISDATDANGCPATPSGFVTITVNDVINLGPVTGNTDVCSNQSSGFSVTPVAGVTSYNWSVPAGANIVSGQGTSAIMVNWNGASSGDVCVEATNSCGVGLPSCTSVALTFLPVQPDPVSGPVDACVGDQMTYSIADVPDATTYNWTAPSNGTILSGQGTTSVLIQWNSSSAGNVCVVASNSCGSSPQRCLMVTVVPQPTSPAFTSGNFSPCEGSTGTYSVNTQASVDNYQWTTPPGATIVSGQGTSFVSIDWTGASPGDLCVDAISSICNVTVSNCQAVNVIPIPEAPASITGDATACVGNALLYSIDPVNGAANYNWTVPAGAVILSGQGTTDVTIRWNIAGSGNICVRAQNTCGNSAYFCLPVTAVAVPSTPTFTSGNFSPCEGSTGTYSINTQASVDDYQWTTPPGATIVSGQGTSSVSIDWTGASPGDLCVDAISSICNVTVSNCQAVNVIPIPESPASITGDATACVGNALPYSIDPVNGAVNYNWTVPTGAVILSGQGTTDVTIRWNTAGSGNICVRAQNTCGNSAYTCLPVAAVVVPTIPVFTAGNFTPCENTALNYGVTPQPAFDTYTWEYDAGGTITNGQGTAAITMDWQGASDGQLCVTASSTVCNVDRTACKPVTIKTLPALPEYVSVNDLLCAGDTGTYVLIPVTGATSYTWEAPGGIFIGSSTGSTVKIKWPDPTFITMNVRANNTCGAGLVQYAPTVSVGTPPAQPGAISGPATVCQGSTHTYSIADVPGANAYFWTVPAGATILSGQNTVSVTVKFNNTGAGNVCVAAKADHCEGPARCLGVSVTTPAGIPGSVSGPAAVCQNSTAVYSISPVTGATGYNWTLPPGATITGGNNTPAVTVSFTGASSGQLCVSAVSGCGNSVPSCTAVTVGTSLTPVISGATSFCSGGSTVLDAGAGYSVYSWSSGQSSQTITVTTPGTYAVTVTATGGCSGTASQVVTMGTSLMPVIAGPAAICPGGSATLDAGTGYTNYAWSTSQAGQAILVSNSGTYTVTVSDASGCTGTDTHTVAIHTPPGPTISGPATICAGSTVTLDAGAGYAGYAWSNTAVTQTTQISDPGIFAVTVTDNNGCTGTDEQVVSIANPPNPPALNFGADTLLCAGAALLLDAGNPGSTYLWSNSATTQTIPVASAGTYAVTVTNGCGQTVDAIAVSYLQAIAVGNVTTNGLSGSFSLSGGLPQVNGSDYISVTMALQGNPGVTATLSSAPFTHGETVTFATPDAGMYEVVVTDAAGCSSMTTITIINSTADTIPPIITCPPGHTLDLDPGACDTVYNYTIMASDNMPGYTVTQLTGLPSGASFPIGPTTNTFICTDLAGNTSSCSFVISVLEFASPVSTLTCKNFITVFLDSDCNYAVSASEVLEGGPYRCYDYYQVEIDKTVPYTDGTWGPNTLFQFDAGETYAVSVLDPISQDRCLGSLKVENTSLPACVLQLTEPLQGSNNISVSTPLSWTSSSGCVSGYRLTLSTTSGGSDLLDNLDVGNVTSYQPLQPLPEGDTVYVRILPYNGLGEASGCQEFWFITGGNCNLVVSAGPDSAVCSGQSVTLTASGGASYQWSDGGPAAAEWTFVPAGTKTYTVTVTDINGCTATDDVVIGVAPPVNATIATPDSTVLTCTNTSLVLEASGGDQYEWPGVSANSNSITVDSPGTYIAIVRNSSTGCSDTTSLAVMEDKAYPDYDNAGYWVECSDTTIYLTVVINTPGATCVWRKSNHLNGPIISTTEEAMAFEPGIYFFTITGPNGCTVYGPGFGIIDLTIPDVSIMVASDSSLSCLSPTIQLTGNSTTPGVYYDWSAPDGNHPGQNMVAEYPGSYTLYARTPTGCENSSEVVLSGSTQIPDVVATGATIDCSGQPVVISSSYTITGVNNPPVSFSWSGPSGFSSSLQNPTVGEPGIYTVTVTAAPGCTGTASAVVNANPAPVATITANSATTFCAGSSVLLAAPFDVNYTYQWQNNGVNLTGATAANLVASSGGNYSVVVSQGTCSATSAPMTVTVKPAPPAGITAAGPLAFCAGSSVVLSAPAGPYSYQWKSGGVNIPGATAANYTATTGGNYSVVVTQNGCNASSPPVTVTVNAIPQATITANGPLIVCNGGSVALTAPAGTGYSYQWQNNGANITGAISGNYTASMSGNYTVVVTQNGCSATSTMVAVTVGTAPISTALIQNICNGDTAWIGTTPYTLPGNYTQVLTAANGCDSTVTLTLNVNPALLEELQATICTGETYNFNGQVLSQPNIYKDTLPGGPNACDTILTLLLNVLPPVYKPLTASVCPNEAYSIGDSTFYKAGNYEVVLDALNGCDTIVLLDLDVIPIGLSLGNDRKRCADDAPLTLAPTLTACEDCMYQWNTGATTAQIEINPTEDAVYILSITDKYQCTVADTVFVQVNQLYLNEKDTTLCPRDTFEFYGEKITTPGVYTKYFQSTAGCDSTISVSVYFWEPSLVDAVADTFFLPPDETVRAFPVVDNDFRATDWQIIIKTMPVYGDAEVPNRDEIRYTRQNTTAFGYDSLLYMLCPEVDCPDLCDSAWLYIFLQGGSLEQIKKLIPNGMTPNDDQYNDTFDPVDFLESMKIAPNRSTTRLYIYNRWAELVFRADSYPEGGWSGANHSGKIMPAGTYYYRLVLDLGEEVVLEGAINLLK